MGTYEQKEALQKKVFNRDFLSEQKKKKKAGSRLGKR